MSDDFLIDDASVQDSRPKELYEIVMGNTTFYYTSGERDVVVGGLVYTAIAIDRSAVVQPKAGDSPAVEIELASDHPIIKRYYRMGVPPRKLSATIRCLQVRSGVVEQIWSGDVTSTASRGATSKLRVPSRTVESMKRSLPTITCGRACLHILYDSMCKISRAGSNGDAIPYRCTTTATAVNGREVTLDLSTVPAAYYARSHWTEGGEVVHVASGERQTVATQSDLSPGTGTITRLAMVLPIPELKVGDSIEVYAGCAHDIDNCAIKFANRHNYGGFSRLPSRNMFDPTHLGGVIVGEM
jgi:hypothetical protein